MDAEVEDLAELVPPSDLAERDEWLRLHQDRIGAAMAAEAGRIAATAVEGYAAGVLTASGDMASLDGMEAAWKAYMRTVAGPQLQGMYLSGSLSAWMSVPGQIPQSAAVPWVSVVNENAVAYQAAATNRIVGASSGMWSDVRAKTVAALRDGMSNEDLKSSIEAVTNYSEFRADTIGRTETMAAYNGGDAEAVRELGEFGPQYKRWLAASDSRTRKAHARADGQVVGLTEMFVVDNERLDHPSASGGSPGNVVNCRCTVEYLYDEDLTDAERERLDLKAEPVADTVVEEV